MNQIPWWGYVILAGLAWGTYVPIIFYGGSELGGKQNARLMAILCVGMAYFVLAVLFPLALFISGQQEWPSLKTTGLVFACLAGVAGAVGAICVVYASGTAMAAGLEAKKLNPDFNPASYRLLIGPLIFGLAPVINTLVSLAWHPKEGDPFGQDSWIPDMPGWKLLIGILLVGVGSFLVLYSKEEAEERKKKAAGTKPTPPAVVAAPTEKPNPA